MAGLAQDALQRYYEKAFESAGEGGSIYIEMSVLERAGHERKARILEELPLPDLSEATVVDYGVGSWGFGCIFPRLKNCRRAIGVDISEFAVECSRKIAEADDALRDKQYEFITSTGYDIKIADGVVDLLFAGECIEHIEDTPAFLAEVHRVLKPGGIAIFTTPNAKPQAYRQLGLTWAMGLEHVALMDSYRLLDEIGAFFTIASTHGYNSTIHPALDAKCDAETARQWAEAPAEFHAASGLVVVARKESDVAAAGKQCHRTVESAEATAMPEHRDLSLFEDVYGRMVAGDGTIRVPIPGGARRCQLVLWSHPWSGIATIETQTSSREVDLYSHVSGCVRETLGADALAGSKFVTIRGTGRKRPESNGDEVIFFRAVFALD